MKLYKIYKIGSNIAFYTFLFNIIYSIYFGWNKTAQSPAEKLLDTICGYTMAIGLCIMLIPIFKLYTHFIKRYDYEKEEEKGKIKDSLSWHFHEESKKHS